MIDHTGIGVADVGRSSAFLRCCFGRAWHAAGDAIAQVDAFHAAALKAGATDNGAPGARESTPVYYAAFVLDPDGNNMEAVFRGG